jgi:hypothetical protein
MSRASKFTLLGTSLFAVGTIVIVHFQQKAEKAVRFPPSTRLSQYNTWAS